MGGKPNLVSHLSIHFLLWVRVHMMCGVQCFPLYITYLTLQLVYSYIVGHGVHLGE